jgi:large subunit ribosomal protein L25
MSEKIILNVTKRLDVGKGASRRLRKQNIIPGILYGEGKDPIQLSFEYKDIKKLIDKDAFYSQVSTLKIDGQDYQAILKDMQRNPVTDSPIHLDFMNIDDTHMITTRIPLHFTNQNICVGAKAGGAIVHSKTDIEVKCLPNDLPEYVEIDMANIDINQHIHLADIVLPSGVTLIDHGKNPEVVSVQLTRAGKSDDDIEEEAATEEKPAE